MDMKKGKVLCIHCEGNGKTYSRVTGTLSKCYLCFGRGYITKGLKKIVRKREDIKHSITGLFYNELEEVLDFIKKKYF
jgi:hypothetical protein